MILCCCPQRIQPNLYPTKPFDNHLCTQSTPDLLFACPPAIFYEGLERLANRYFGRQKISVIVKDNKE